VRGDRRSGAVVAPVARCSHQNVIALAVAGLAASRR
jgi:hypothetical protein